MNESWIPIEIPPKINMKVEWRCEDGSTDIGFYYADTQTFGTFDPNSQSRITHYKPFKSDFEGNYFQKSYEKKDT